MKATGLIRPIDKLGRVVIPKGILRTLKIKEGDPLEVFVDRDGQVIMQKYSPIGELSEIAQAYADALYETMGHISCIGDQNTIIAVAGAPKKVFFKQPMNASIERVMEARTSVIINNTMEHEYYKDAAGMAVAYFANEVITPIISGDEPMGTVIMGSRDPAVIMTELEQKLVETAAAFLGKQMR